MNLKKSYLPVLVLVILAWAGIYYQTDWKPSQIIDPIKQITSQTTNNTSKSQKDKSIKERLKPDQTTINYNKKDKIQQNQKADIPQKFQFCQKKANMTDCIISLDTEKWNTDPNYILNKDKLVKRLDEIDSFVNNLEKTNQNTKQKITQKLQQKYLQNDPSFVFEQTACQTNTCQTIITQTKKKLIDRIASRWRLKDSSTCKKIPEKNIQKYCLNKLN